MGHKTLITVDQDTPFADLLGTYLSFVMADGREVVGVLRAFTLTTYTVELPNGAEVKEQLAGVQEIRVAPMGYRPSI
jgi:hypothetical protein